MLDLHYNTGVQFDLIATNYDNSNLINELRMPYFDGLQYINTILSNDLILLPDM